MDNSLNQGDQLQNGTPAQAGDPIPSINQPTSIPSTQPSPTDNQNYPQTPITNYPTNQSPDVINPQVIISPNITQKRFGLPILLAVTFIVIVLSGFGAYAVAYNKITLPEKQQNIQFAIIDFVQSLPFTPKTPEFLLAKALLAQDGVNKESYDISVAIDSPNATLIPEIGPSIDIQAKGQIDYSNREDIKFTLNASVTKDLNVDLIKPDNNLYFKINKIPSLLLSFTGLKTSAFDPAMNKWFFYDTTPLDTEARKELKENSGDKQVISDKFVKDNLDNYIDERILNEIKIQNENIDGFAVYTLSIDADTELIDYIGKLIEEEEKKKNGSDLQLFYEESQKLSDIIKSMHWEVNIDKQNYYVRKVAITANLEVDEISSYGALLGTSSLSETQNVNFSLAAKFSDFGKQININTPQDSGSWEDFTATLSEIFNKMYSETIESSYNKARDAKTKSNLNSIRAALELYKSENNNYPTSLDSLTPRYFVEIPKDNEGNSYFYIMYVNTYDLCGNLDIPEPDKDTCPNPEYNYHLSTP